MMIKPVAFVCAILAATPTIAAQFYIVQDTKKQACTVSEEPAKGEDQINVGDGAYAEEAIARSDMTKMLACKSPEASGDQPAKK
jgi:hypothetical protein